MKNLNHLRIITFFFCLGLLISSTIGAEFEQPEEGWRWKRTLVLRLGNNQYPVDSVHSQLEKDTKLIQVTLNTLLSSLAIGVQPQEVSKVIGPIRALLKQIPSARAIFEKLSTEDKNIGDIFTKEKSGEQLKAFWFDNIDFPKEPENNDKIINILRQNLQRISTRNIVLADIGSVVKGKYKSVPVSDLKTDKKAVFLSGTGNRLIELLESTFFPRFIFITFDRPYRDEKGDEKMYEGFLKGNLGYVLSHTSDRIPDVLKQKSKDYKKELDIYIGASRELLQKQAVYNENIQKLVEAQPKPLDVKSSEGLRQSQTALRETLKLTMELETKLQEVQASFQAALRLIPDFYHCEQLLRLFLYNNLESLVEKDFSLLDIEQFLSLHIHSSNDVCERCAHCLFLESEMCNVVTEEKRPQVRKGKDTFARDPYGFFEKFYNKVKDTKPNLKYQILATSNIVGEQRGVGHRYQSGHDMHANNPIDLEVFPPLLAFNVIPGDFVFKALPASLTPTQAGDGSLQQSYFPTVSK